jgi:hypothetical protein
MVWCFGLVLFCWFLVLSRGRHCLAWKKRRHKTPTAPKSAPVEAVVRDVGAAALEPLDVHAAFGRVKVVAVVVRVPLLLFLSVGGI